MKNKPFYLTAFPVLALLIAVSFPIQIHVLYRTPITDFQKLFAMLTPLNLMTMASLTLMAVLTMTMSKWIYKAIPALLAILFINNAVVGLYGTDFTLFQVGLSFALFGVSLKPFYKHEIKAVIRNPKLRWWKTPTRYNIKKSVKLNTEYLEMFSETSNLSTTGLFAVVSEEELMDQLELDQFVDITIFGDKKIDLQARVVRKNTTNKNIPKGFGLEIVRNDNHKKDYLPWLKEETAVFTEDQVATAA